MKFTWRTEIPVLLLLAVTLAIALWAWPGMPDRVPVHWGFDGRPDRWGSRAEALLIAPGLGLLLYGLFFVIPMLDPGRVNYERFAGAYLGFRLALFTFIAALQVVLVSAARNAAVDMNVLMPPLVGALFVVIGNLLGKLRPNWFLGIRTPWTLSSKRSWIGTHRLGGWTFIAIGLVWIASSRLPVPLNMAVPFGVLFAGVIALTIVSYVLWSRDPDKVFPAGTQPAKDDDRT